MGAFETDELSREEICPEEQCILVNKIYDQCRAQLCLTPDMLGPARYAAATTVNSVDYLPGDIITPPASSTFLTAENFTLSDITILSKTANSFRTGYWDIEVKYTFNYTLIFKNSSGTVLATIPAESVYKTRQTLFGSITTGTVSVVEGLNGETPILSGPFVNVEAKAMLLDAKLKYPCTCICESDDTTVNPVAITITIGLFAITRLLRQINIVVPSMGSCVPEECEDIAPEEPCDYFSNLDFPLDIFSPPDSCAFPKPVKGCGCEK